MNKKAVSGIVLTTLMIGILAVAFEITQTKSSPSGKIVYVPAQYTTIQEAIENVTDGDIIEVYPLNTSYCENVTVNKRLTIRRFSSAPSGEYPVVDGGGEIVFKVTAPGVEISGFEIRNGSCGILLKSSHNTIINNTVRANTVGIFIAGESGNNTLRENRITGNTGNFGVEYGTQMESLPLDHFIQDIDESNTVDGKPIYYLVNQHNQTITPDAGYLAIVNSTGIIVENLPLEHNCQDMLVAYSSQITVRNFKCQYPSTKRTFSIIFVNVNKSAIQNVTFSDTEKCILLRFSEDNIVQNNRILSTSTYGILFCGIELVRSNDNLVADNTITNDDPQETGIGIRLLACANNSIVANSITRTYWGLVLEGSNGSILFHNNFCNNLNQPIIEDSFNSSFDNEYEGNHWGDDYTGEDMDGDGIGDTPYHQDNCPLIDPWNASRIFERPMKKEGSPAWTQKLYTFSNSTLGSPPIGFTFDRELLQFNLKVTSGYKGFLNITIPRKWVDGPFTVWVDEIKVEGCMPLPNATYSFINITYDRGRHIITIEGTELGGIAGDLNLDGIIDIYDAVILSSNAGAEE